MTRLTHSPRPLRAPTVAVLDARPDGVLLARFLADGDAAAFATLVGRHTPAIRAACATWLRSAADIDDAAQATFLVLVRRADTLRDGDKVGAWLCRVAGYVARRLRKELRRAEPLTVDPPARSEPAGSDRADLLAEEVDRLPEKYRVPVLMHYSAGLSTADIADRLGCPKGTVLTRLDRGRKLLERRLSARGWTAAALVIGAVARPLSAAWILATARGAGLGEGVAEYAKFVKLAEPLINEMLTDLPFSYQFRLSGDKLTILNYRALLAGPNPLSKVGGLVGGGESSFGVLMYFQALGVAMEGSYTAGDAEPRDKPKAKPLIRKPSGKKTTLLLPGLRKADPNERMDAVVSQPFAPGQVSPTTAGPFAPVVGSPEVGLMPAYAQAEEVRQVGTKLRRFWFGDRPSHLTPERIHGGIANAP